MSTAKRKINVGLLPEQTEDYSQYEESELNWGRIIPAAVLAFIIIIFFIYSFLKSEEVPTNNIDSIVSHEQKPNITKTKASATSEPEKNQATLKNVTPSVHKSESLAKTAEANTAKPDETLLTKKATIKVASPLIREAATITKVDAKPTTKTQQKKPYIHQINTVPPVKILDTHIKKAQLSSDLIKGMPIDALSSQVFMSDEGIIRVHLYTEMEDLRGQNLFHHWYLNGVKQARVRIPINHNHQRSSSSKFINKQMLGKWVVQVLDEQGKAYIEVNFEVVSP